MGKRMLIFTGKSCFTLNFLYCCTQSLADLQNISLTAPNIQLINESIRWHPGGVTSQYGVNLLFFNGIKLQRRSWGGMSIYIAHTTPIELANEFVKWYILQYMVIACCAALMHLYLPVL